MTVLDGSTVEAAGLRVLGDDDPEHNIPFSVERTLDRPETEEQLGQRLVDGPGPTADVMMVHQPGPPAVMMAAPDLPARLVRGGISTRESGPRRHTTPTARGQSACSRAPRAAYASHVHLVQHAFSPPLIVADVYFYFRDDATGLITGVQPVHFRPSHVVIDDRMPTGDLDRRARRRPGCGWAATRRRPPRARRLHPPVDPRDRRQRRTRSESARRGASQTSGLRAGDWRTKERNMLFVLRVGTTTADTERIRATRSVADLRVARRRLEDEGAEHAFRSASGDDNGGYGAQSARRGASQPTSAPDGLRTHAAAWV